MSQDYGVGISRVPGLWVVPGLAATDPVKGDKGEGTESEKEESDKGDRTDPTKGESVKDDKIDSKVPKYKLGHLSLRKWIISGVLGSYTGVVSTRHHSSILCILPNLISKKPLQKMILTSLFSHQMSGL